MASPKRPRNACAREIRKKLVPPPKNPTASSSRPPKPNVTTQLSSQPQAAVVVTTRPDITIRKAGLWAHFWLFIGCLSPEYTDDFH
ncbi:hypothetical protein C8R48DRAFT_776989 [Suillus tomentosus]|nr:hypothetical protein C8R48DRAFT_776989 [Suillus tomentosus]